MKERKQQVTQRIRRFIGIGVLAVGGLGFTSPVEAQQGVIDLEETVIKGRIQKPEAFYILQNASLEYERLDIKPSFIDEVLESVKEEDL